MKYKFIVFTLIIALLPISKSFTQTDSTYIAPFEKDFAVQVYTQHKFMNLIEAERNGQNEVGYNSNKPIEIGAGVSWRGISLSGSYSLNFAADPKYGKTESFDFQYHRYAKSYVWDVYYLKYKGLYTDDKEITLYPSVKINQIGSSAYYIFNNNKFSYRATFGQREKQLKSAGSLILGGGFFYNTLEAYQSQLSEDELNLESLQIGVSAGYAYTWVFPKGYFITGSLSGGASIGSVNQTISLDNLNAYPSLVVRVASGYNAKDWSAGFAFVDNMMEIIRTKNHRVMLNTGNVRFTFIKRFSSSKIFGSKSDKIYDIHDKIYEKIPFYTTH